MKFQISICLYLLLGFHFNYPLSGTINNPERRNCQPHRDIILHPISLCSSWVQWKLYLAFVFVVIVKS